MRVPFPYDLRIGTDIVHLPRFQKAHHSFPKLVARILQPVEQRLLNERYPRWSAEATSGSTNENKRVNEWLCGRWAAKEAAKKAWGASLLSFTDLRIEATSRGDLQVICAPLHGGMSERACDEQAARVSISHDGEYAMATVLASPLHESIIAELGRRKAEAEKKVTPSDQHQHITDASS